MNARHGSAELGGDFAAKAIEIPRSHPLLRRTWVRRLAFCTACAAGLLGAVALAFFARWHDDGQADLARQRQCAQAFLRSAEFAEFACATDRQFVALVNFIAVQPQQARATLPAVAARETAQRLLPWTHEVVPLPISAAAEPERVVHASRAVGALLARRGFVTDEAARKKARDTLLRHLAPYEAKFRARSPDSGFPALSFDRGLQEAVLAGYAAHVGPATGVVETERMFALYALVGPAMWRAIERDAQPRPTFAALTR